MSEHTTNAKANPERIGEAMAENKNSEPEIAIRGSRLFPNNPEARNDWTNRALASFRAKSRAMGRGPVIVD